MEKTLENIVNNSPEQNGLIQQLNDIQSTPDHSDHSAAIEQSQALVTKGTLPDFQIDGLLSKLGEYLQDPSKLLPTDPADRVLQNNRR